MMCCTTAEQKCLRHWEILYLEGTENLCITPHLRHVLMRETAVAEMHVIAAEPAAASAVWRRASGHSLQHAGACAAAQPTQLPPAPAVLPAPGRPATAPGQATGLCTSAMHASHLALSLSIQRVDMTCASFDRNGLLANWYFRYLAVRVACTALAR